MMLQPLANNSRKAAVSQSASVPAPVRGWNAKDSLADMGPDWAITMDNIFPNLTDVELRGGSASHSTGNGTGAVETLVEYSGPATKKLLSCAGGVIYDASAAGASTSIATGKSNNRWQTTMFGTAGGNFLYMVNGVDAPIYYDGSAFTTPSLTGVTATDIVDVLAHHHRLFFAFNDSLTIGYLAVNSIAGAVSTFDLGGLCNKGGKIQALASWTRDGGSGPDDIFVAITSEGECILYSGTDPGTAADWLLVGSSFSIGKPIGRRCVETVGTEVIVTTQDGAIELGSMLPIDRVGAAGRAMSDNIHNVFLESARLYGATFGWQSIHYPQGSYALFNVPITATTSHQYVANTLTGAWCRFKGQNAACWSLYNGDLYFGATSGGVVYKADTGTSDAGANIGYILKPAFNYFGKRGVNKLFSLCRPHITTNGAISVAIDLNVDFENVVPTSIPSPVTLTGGVWDVSLWDQANWTDTINIADWLTVYGLGDCATPTIRGAENALSIKFSSYDIIYQTGVFL
tara:strand:- start:615 stop:2162 length:1548 start_codon:yes stop_codon:yes gene_type:complete